MPPPLVAVSQSPTPCAVVGSVAEEEDSGMISKSDVAIVEGRFCRALPPSLLFEIFDDLYLSRNSWTILSPSRCQVDVNCFRFSKA